MEATKSIGINSICFMSPFKIRVGSVFKSFKIGEVRYNITSTGFIYNVSSSKNITTKVVGSSIEILTTL